MKAQILAAEMPALTPYLLQSQPVLTASQQLENADLQLAATALAGLSLPRAALLLRAMTASRRTQLLATVDPQLREYLELLLQYPAHSAGALMDPRVLHLQPSMPIAAALDQLRDQQFHKRPTQTRRILLLLDAESRVEGMVAIQDLVMALPDELLRDYMQQIPATVHPSASHEEIAAILEEHHVSSLPVVDANDRLVGIVRQEELDAIAREDAAGDIQAMFGVSREEQALSPPLFSVKQRLPWLQINLFTAFMAAAIVGAFADMISSYTALAVLLPVVAGQSGNTGAQALAVVMRGLTLHEISLSHWRRVLGKETLVGLLNGLGVALTSALVVYVWSGSLGLNCAADVGALWSGPGAVVVDHSDHYHRYRRLLQFSQHCQLAGGNHLVCDKLSRRLARSGHVPGHRDTSRCL